MSNSPKNTDKKQKPASIVKLEQARLNQQKDAPSNTGNMNDKQAMSALKQHGGNILFVIAVALAGFFGWTYFQQHNIPTIDTVAADKFNSIQVLNQQVQGSKLIPELAEANKENLTKQQNELTASIDSLVHEHKDSVFAWEALMLKARGEMDDSDYAAASESLKQAMGIQLHDAGLQAITTLRLGQALLAKGDFDEALKVTNVELAMSFEGSQQELLGDIYLENNDKEAAIRSYENAWSMMNERKENRSILALKLESLGITPEPIETDSMVANTGATRSVSEAPSGQPSSSKSPSEQVAEIESQSE